MITDSRYNKNIEVPFTIKKPPENKRTGGRKQGTLGFNQLVHDLKSPVNSLKGIIQLANMQVTDEQAKEFFFMMDECVNKLEDKISNTLNMFEKGTDLPDVSLLDFEAILYEIMISLGHIEGYEQISFSTNIKNSKPFYSSKPLVESVIQNLLENAIKYRCKDRTLCMVKISITDSDRGIKIEVSDNGIGIAREFLPHIFDANFKSVMEKDNSHGLGLFIVQRAVEKMNGTLETTSTLDVGTSFTVELPNAAE